MFLLLETPILDISAISVTSVGICTLEHRVQFSAKKPISVSFLERHLAITLSHAYGFVSYLHRGPKIIGIHFFASASRAFGIFLNNDCFSSHRCEDYIKCRWICAIHSPISILERLFSDGHDLVPIAQSVNGIILASVIRPFMFGIAPPLLNRISCRSARSTR